MTGSGRQKKGKRKLHSNKLSNKSGVPTVEPCPESGPKQCDSDTCPELGSKQDTIGMHDLKLCFGSNSPVYNLMNCSDEELEGMLLKKLENIYNRAIDKLMSFSYPRDVVWSAVLTSGCVFGDDDIVENIVQNSVDYIKTDKSKCDGTYKDRPQVSENLKSLVRSSLDVILFTLSQARPKMKKGDAMKYLLISNFHLGFVSILKGQGEAADGTFQIDISKVASTSGASSVQGDQEFADCENPSFGNKRTPVELQKLLRKSRTSGTDCNLTSSYQSRLKKRVANFAASFQAGPKASSKEAQAEKNSFMEKMSTEQLVWEDSYVDKLILDGIGDKDSTSKSADQKSKTISILVHNIKEAKDQAKEQKEWAKTKVLEAAKKLSNDLLELKAIRMEKRKQKYESDSGGIEQEQRMVTRLMELEKAMDQTTCQYDMLNKAFSDMEDENAEIRADIEANKLRASESNEKLAEIATKEKKSVKKMMSLEKHNIRLLEEIEQEREKSLQLQQQMTDLKAAQEQMEVMWRQEVKGKELAISQLQEEQKLKEEAEVNTKRRQQAFRQKLETDRLKHKEEVQRLEQEIARLEMSLEASGDMYHLPDYLFSWESEVLETNTDTFQNQLPGSSERTGLCENEVTCDRMCMICKKKEVSVLFLPCAHQVLCADCNNEYYYGLEARCPCCNGPIDERIHVYGARS